MMHHTSQYDCLNSVIKAKNANELLNALVVELVGYQVELEGTIKYAEKIGGFEPTTNLMRDRLTDVNRALEMLASIPSIRSL